MQQNKVGEPKLFKLFGHFSLALVLGVSSLSAQSFEDFKKSQAESFKKYKDERDNAFNKYLKAQWKAYNVFKGTPLYEKPKPKKIAPAKPKPIKSEGPKVSIKIKEIKLAPVVVTPVVKKEVVKETPKLVTPPPAIVKKELSKPKKVIVKKVETPKEKVVTKELVTPKQVAVVAPITEELPRHDINFDFYGSQLGFDIPSKVKRAKFYPQNQKGITNYFDSAASSEYKPLLEQIKSVKNDLNLNDWGVYLLVRQISDKTYTNMDNSRLLSWFLFNKLGYAVKVGLANKHVVLMHYSKKIIYSTPNYSFGKKKFYVVSHYAKGSVGRLYSYAQNYPGADAPLDLSLKSLPKFVENVKSKTLTFKKFGNSFPVTMEYNKNLLDFMATYPQADYDTFFNAPLDERTYVSIAKSLKKYVDGKKTSDAMNFVLNFVQKSFDYQRDDQQFGREKVMFAQETLYFDKSDCEDRAILFSYLIKELFGIGVVGIKYKDHMATALYVPMDGDKVKKGSKKFVVADPTYINASIGQSMPKYRALKPENFVTVKKN